MDNYLELNPDNFHIYDVSNIQHSKPVKTGNNYIALSKYEDQPIKITTSKLLCRNGLQIVDNDHAYLELEFNKSDEELYTYLAELDELHISRIYDNSKQWFGNQIPLNMIDDFYRPTLRLGKNSKHPIIRLKVPVEHGKLNVTVCNQYRRPLSITELNPNAKIKATFRYEGLRFLKQQCFSNFVVESLKVYVPKKGKDSFQFTDNNDFELFSDAESYEEPPVQTNKEDFLEEVYKQEVLKEPVIETDVEQEQHHVVEQSQHQDDQSISEYSESASNSESGTESAKEDLRDGFVERVNESIKEIDRRLKKIDKKKNKKKVLITSRKKRVYEVGL